MSVASIRSLGAFLLALASCGGGTAAPPPSASSSEDEDPPAIFADAEALAEEGLGGLLAEAGEAFAAIGVELAVEGRTYRLSRAGATATLVETESEEAFVLAIGEETFRIDRSESSDWEAATRGALAALDHALAQIGAPERAYALYFGGNDQSFLLLTPEARRRRDANVPMSERLTGAE